jgi:VWFA-related protein
MPIRAPRPLAALAAATAMVVVASASRSPVFGQAGVRERTLYVSVLNEKGEPLDGLGPDDFVVREDGVRREVLRASRAVEPIDIALLVDNSLAAEDDIRNIRDALTKFVERMHADNPITIITLADRPTIVQDYTNNLTLLKNAIGRLFAQPGSGMMLLDAIVEVSRGLGKRENPRAVIVPVITEGTEFSNLHYQSVLDALKASGAALHVMTIGTPAKGFDDPIKNRATVLDQGPRRSGGGRDTVLSSMAMTTTLERKARELKSQYKVVYGRSQSLIPAEKIEVSVARPGVTARGTPARGQSGA